MLRGSKRHWGPVITQPLPLGTARRGAALPSGSKQQLALRRALRDKELRGGKKPAALRGFATPRAELLEPLPLPSLPFSYCLTPSSRGKKGSKQQPGQELLNAASSAPNSVPWKERQRAQRTNQPTQIPPRGSVASHVFPRGRSDLPLSGMFGSQRSKRSWFNHQAPG